MKSTKALSPRLIFLVASLALSSSGCGLVPTDIFPDSLFPDRTLTPGLALAPISGTNVMAVTVNGALCSAGSYVNKPCVSVTICPATMAPGSAPDGTCQTLNDVLLDTGSSGLRVFKSALRQDLLNSFIPETTSASKPIAECITFGDGSQDWGSIQTASVVLGHEGSVQVPIQIIDSNFADPSSACSGANVDITEAGYTAILGVGLFAQDCGTSCAFSWNSSNGMYFACDASVPGSACNGVGVALSKQVSNPVSALPVDNNGVIVDLPAIPLGGVDYADGYLILGIGTQANNAPPTSGAIPTTYNASTVGEFTTTLGGNTYSQSFIDSGSNDLYFQPTPAIDDCGSVDPRLSNWFCPSTVQTFSATNNDTLGTISSPPATSFQIGSFVSLFGTTNNNVFVELGQNSQVGGSFDWGLPFFLGKKVYVGIEHTPSTLGTGPYWAY